MVRDKEEDVPLAEDWQRVLDFPMQALTRVFPHLSSSTKGYIEVTNLPGADADSEEQTEGQQLIAMVHQGLRTTPNYDKALGLAVTRAWSVRSGTYLMEMQSAWLAASAPQELDGLTMAQQKLGIRTITAGDVEAEGITLDRWARRQSFIMHLLLLGAALSGIRAFIPSSLTSGIFGRKSAKTLPFDGSSLVRGASSFQANQQTSCVARSSPKESGGELWEIGVTLWGRNAHCIKAGHVFWSRL